MSTITAGYDFFETPPGGADLNILHAFPIPADFFHKGSARFVGPIHFDGHPIGEFTDPRTGKKHKAGTTDTVVHRKSDVVIKGNSGSGTTEIELVRLSLRSSAPIEVQVGHHVQLWDVYVSQSSSKPSTGTMTITQTNDSGGHFAATFHVAPLIRFAARHGEERHLDIGALGVPAEKQALLVRLSVMEANEVPWEQSPPEGESALVLPGVTSNFRLVGNGALLGPFHSHIIYRNAVLPV